MNTVRHIRTIIILFALLMGATSEVWAQEPSTLTKANIIIDGGTQVGETYEYTFDHGSVAVKSVEAQTRTVTLTITPSAGYCIQKSDIVVQKLVDPAVAGAPRRVLDIADHLAVSGPTMSKSAADYTFVVPADYAGAMVTVTFRQLAAAIVPVTANPLIYTDSAQELVTLGTVVGTKFDSGTKLDADASLAGYYTKSNDVYTPCNADDKSDGTTIYYKPLVTYSDTENGTYSSTIPTGTNAGNYTVYYKYVADEDHADGSGSVTVVINKAPITSVELVDYVKKHTGSAISFSTKSVKAGEISVSSNDYSVSGDALTQTAVGTYTCTVTAKPTSTNFTGSASVNFRIVEDNTVFIPDDNSSPSDMTRKYVLTADISASVLAGLYSTTEDFTGELDGNFHKITGLSGHGLFNTISGDGKVKNVILDNVTISGDTNVGAICNEAKGNTRIYNCGVLATESEVETDKDGYTSITSNSSTINGDGYVGGIVGLLDGSSRVINCFSYAEITGGTHRGGIVGYNNVASTSGNLKTMVMNCMFYGNISTTGSPTQIAPIYCGEIIHNKRAAGTNTGLNNYCYFLYDEEQNPYVKSITTYNGSLGAEKRFLCRFELFRLTLNSTRSMAAFYVCGNATDKAQMAKWVLDKSIAPYPILRTPGYYPSIVNPDAEHAIGIDANNEHRNEGRKLGTLTVKINSVGSGAQFGAPSGAHLIDENGNTVSSRTLILNVTDKDYANHNFNYKKIQLPYYSEVGTGNYTKASDESGRVVTGWKITGFTGGTAGTFTSSGADVTFDANGNITATPFNFVDRKCTNKDLYGTGGSNRVFNQGAYWEVPDDVTEITIEPYWAKAVYLSDANYDVTYSGTNKYGVTVGGTFSSPVGTQTVETSMTTAITNLAPTEGHTVYDYAVVLVGNYHHYTNNAPSNDKKPLTIMSADLDGDCEPDNTLFYYHNARKNVSPIRFDFLNMPGVGMVKRTWDATSDPEPGIFKPNGWFEVTNTVFVRFGQFEYAEGPGGSGYSGKLIESPLILQGGIYEQFVTSRAKNSINTNYLLVGGNAWFKNFANGCHTNTFSQTPKIPINVTGGDFENFYLTGIYQPDGNPTDEDAECYIDGGRFVEVAGAGMQRIDGSVTWLINAADITNFFGGGINDAQSITGNITTKISNSYVDEFYGGPKFGNMTSGKKVKTTATDCHFGKFFGAGYGGTSLNHLGCEDATIAADKEPSWSTYLNHYTRSYETTHHITPGNKDVTVNAISTSYDYEYILMSDGSQTVARFFVNFASLSLASTRDVISNLTGCTIGDFYGGGRLGAVNGNATSTLTNCTVTGNAFGAGYSADVPTVEVWPSGVGLSPVPKYNRKANVFNNANVKLPNEQENHLDDIHLYKWTNGHGLSTSSPFYDNVDNDGYFIYTSVPLNDLGAVTGTATLTINGTTTVAKSVYGGGEDSGVDGNTVVTVNNGTIGTAGKGGATHGNVYGGGKGKAQNEEGETFDDLSLVKMGLVKGNTNVTINGGSILHNVYGGGAFGSVGDFNYDASGNITSLKTADTGKANVTITGGTIGTTGKENGMVFGSSRGDVDEPGSIQDRLAWVHDTHVVIGTAGQGFNAPQPQIKGSVYGSGENGHTYQNTIVDVHSGTIGIASGVEVEDEEGNKYQGAAYPYRGNVYGGGCGTDTYTVTENAGTENAVTHTYYNPLAGIVQGNATVTIDGGHVVHNVYGAGAMGSVGTADVAISGTTTINISGGTVGVNGTAGDGNVFGAARGSAKAATSNGYALVRNYTTVNIGGKASVKGNVYGGGELGCVGRYKITEDMRNFYWTDEELEEEKTSYTYNNTGVSNVNISGGTIGAHVFGGGKGKADTFWCEKGIVYKTNVSITDGTVNGNVYGGGEVGRVETDATVKIGPDTGIGSPDVKGNVFGAGAGVETHGYSALVRGNTYVTIQSSAKVGESVYGGGKIAAVGKYYLVNQEYLDTHPGTKLEIGMPYSLVSDELGICTVNVKGKAQIGYKGTGHVFGAGKGQEPVYYLGDVVSYTNRDDMPRRMMSYNPALYNDEEDNLLKDLWEYTDASEKYVWEYFDTKAKYLTFLETLGLVTQTDLTTGGEATVSGNIYGGSESGFVQHNVKVKLKESCVIGTTTTDGNVFGGGLGLAYFSEAGRVSGSTDVTIEGGTARGNVYGGGSLGDVGTINKADIKNYKWTDEANPGDTYTYNNTGVCNVTITGGTIGIDNPEKPEEHGNVFGGGKGLADNFWCEKAMVYSTNVSIKNSGTTVKGSVFGGGQIGRVEDDVKVEIGTESGTDEPEIKGDVFGAGKGLKTHGYSALTRGNVNVTIQGSAKVGESVYGGGEIASVGRYKIKEGDNNPLGAPDWVLVGMPYSLANSGSGKCVVIVRDNAEIGPDNMVMHNTTTGKPDDSGHVIGAGKGVLPYEGFGVTNDDWETTPWRMAPGNIEEQFTEAYYTEHSETYEGHDYKTDYFKYIETLALATETEVTISGNAFVKGSVYGGSLNGYVQHDTKVTIEGGQIGAGAGMTEPYQETDWTGSTTPAGGWKPCAHWEYEGNGAPYDPLATTSGTYDYTNYSFVDYTDKKSSSEGGLPTATDGHTYYGNVFGGGSGVIPYAPGLWHRGAGSVGGNIKVDITGGHILTNVYGGNECTDVGTYEKENGLSTAIAWSGGDPKGQCVINMSGGTIGVPRTDVDIKALPTIGHLYGAGKGDKRIFFNTWTNVISTEVKITGNARIYGSTFGGGEDGHVLNDTETTIGGSVTIGETSYSYSNVIIGSTGTSGSDGDVFGGGQGSINALTAGVVGGNVNLSIQNGQVLGSVYGGGRIAAVGTNFSSPDAVGVYGELQEPAANHGNITVSLTGGTIEQNVFGGGMGTTDNTYSTANRLAISRNVTVDLNKNVAENAKGCIVKGYIFGCNNANSTPQGHAKVHIHATQNANEATILDKNDAYDVKGVFGGGNQADYVPAESDTQQSTEVIIEGCDLTSIEEVYGGGYGAATPATKVEIKGTKIINNVFGGGYGAGSSDPTAANYNPGANVGFRTGGDAYTSGDGKAIVQLMAGKVNNIYGGSNTKGDIRGGSSITNVPTEYTSGDNQPCCPILEVGNIYGGGKDAEMTGGTEIVLGCMPNDWIAEIYAGAKNADVGNDVSLTLTSGKFGRVFGGNKSGGRLNGSIEVNIEENATCGTPIIIGELYGGGFEAPYSIYGYYQDGTDKDGNPIYKPRTEDMYNEMSDSEKESEGIKSGPHQHPRINVCAFTSIGNIFGGGYGEPAVMVGNPTVNINEVKFNKNVDNYSSNAYNPETDNNKPALIDGVNVKLWPHTDGEMGVIGNVFGGGNAAQVIGNTYVNIATGDPRSRSTVPNVKFVSTGVVMPVDGADIRGNVFGGGNRAEVTGDTNVTIGKKRATP